jgi:3-oxoacyl-[acyl-carrier protein] reductase
MELGIKGKVALVTGAGSQSGFGKGVALVLAKEGCDVIVFDMDLEGAEKTAAEVKALGQKSVAYKVDVTKAAEVRETVDKALKEFGKIDILANIAGGSTPPQLFVETSEEKWDKDINLNLKGVMNCTRAVLPQMVERKSGKIVSTTSVAGLTGTPTGASYCAAKAGVILFTDTLSKEVAEIGINVNCIAPGLGNTGFFKEFGPEWAERTKAMEDAGKTTTPADIGNTVAFLASDVSKKIMGQCIRVSGVL